MERTDPFGRTLADPPPFRETFRPGGVCPPPLGDRVAAAWVLPGVVCEPPAVLPRVLAVAWDPPVAPPGRLFVVVPRFVPAVVPVRPVVLFGRDDVAPCDGVVLCDVDVLCDGVELCEGVDE